ncbi:MAG: helix-turn-helix transcriptional regulator [bacterium]|nr:helix-turn-helix transcriptional regulator [bacterium]
MYNPDKRRNDFIQIGKRIQYYRNKSNLTQEQLAEQAGTSQKHLSRIELGYHLPNFETIIAIAKALDVPIDAFVQDLDENKVNTFLELIKPDISQMSNKQLEMLKKQIELIKQYDCK